MKMISTLLKSVLLIGLFISSYPLSAHEPSPRAPIEQLSIDINTADALAISNTLKGIGLSKANAIIAYRESYGSFHAIEELEAVKGIGKTTIEKNKHLIRIE